MRIAKETISKATDSLNALAQKGEFDAKERKENSKMFNTSNTHVTHALELGWIVRTGYGRYKCTLPKFEPFHTRKIIERQYKHIKENGKQQKIVFRDIPQKKQRAEAKPRKEVSFLWGMLKFKY